MIDFDEEYYSSIRSITVQKAVKVNVTTRFFNGKMLMFSKISLKSFVYNLTDVFMFPNEDINKIYEMYKVEKCFLYQNLTDTDSTSIFFIFVCDLGRTVDEAKSRKTIFEVMIKSFLFLIDLIYLTVFGINLVFEMKS